MKEAQYKLTLEIRTDTKAYKRLAIALFAFVIALVPEGYFWARRKRLGTFFIQVCLELVSFILNSIAIGSTIYMVISFMEYLRS